MKLRTSERFKNLPLFEELLPIMNYLINRPSSGHKKEKLSSKEKYYFNIIISANNIFECLDQINHSIEMLTGFKNRKESSMNRHDYIVFMIENFYLRITSIFDRILIFTNIVFDFGLPEKECRVSTIIENNKIKSTDIERKLIVINNFINSFRKSRNLIAHRKRYSEEFLEKIEGLYLLLDIDKSKETEKYKEFSNIITNGYIKNQKIEFSDKVKTLEQHIREFFDVIYPYVVAFARLKSGFPLSRE